ETAGDPILYPDRRYCHLFYDFPIVPEPLCAEGSSIVHRGDPAEHQSARGLCFIDIGLQGESRSAAGGILWDHPRSSRPVQLEQIVSEPTRTRHIFCLTLRRRLTIWYGVP